MLKLHAMSIVMLAVFAMSAPPVEPVVDRRVRAVLNWAVTPACSGFQHVYDPRDHPAIIHSVRTPPTTRQPGSILLLRWYHALLRALIAALLGATLRSQMP